MTSPNNPDSHARTLTLREVVEWIDTLTDEDIDDVLQALQSRHDVLHAERAAQAVVGRIVRIDDVRPKYLQGLTGEIVNCDGDFVDILLDCKSTGRLRFTRQTRYEPGAVRNYRLESIPASCCYDPVPADAAAGDQASA